MNATKEVKQNRLKAAREIKSWLMIRVLWERFNAELGWLGFCVMIAVLVYVRMGK